jgi:hypothetical protein
MEASFKVTRASVDAKTLKKFDYRGAKIKHFKMFCNYGSVMDEVTSSPSFQRLRQLIFMGIETEDLLSSFSSITDEPGRKSSFKRYTNFVGWMCRSSYKYADGECLTLYIRNSSANEVMDDVLKALDGKEWSKRLFKLGCEITISLHDKTELSIRLINH